MNFQKKTVRMAKTRFSKSYSPKRVFRFFAGTFFGKSRGCVSSWKMCLEWQKSKKKLFLRKFRWFPVFLGMDHSRGSKTRFFTFCQSWVDFAKTRKMPKMTIFREICSSETRIDLQAQKALESGQGVKRREMIYIFRKKLSGWPKLIHKKVTAQNVRQRGFFVTCQKWG